MIAVYVKVYGKLRKYEVDADSALTARLEVLREMDEEDRFYPEDRSPVFACVEGGRND